MDSILKTNIDFDILVIQEPLWSFICNIPSFSNKEGDSIVGTVPPNHPNWITFSRPSNNNNDHPHVIMYINTHLSHLHFSL